MHYFLIKPCALLLLNLLPQLNSQHSEAGSLEQTLRRHHWQKRVLLVAAPTATHPDFKAQKTLLAPHQSGLVARE